MHKPFRLFLAPLKGLLLLVLSLCSTTWAGELNLGWDTDAGAAGFIIYYGTSIGNYTFETDTGTNTTVTIEGLLPGLTYYFAIAAYDSNGVQSALSSEISYTMPGIVQLSLGMNPGDPMILTFPEAPGHWYEVQASPDLVVWTTIGQTEIATANDQVQFPLPQTQSLPQRFFRLAMH